MQLWLFTLRVSDERDYSCISGEAEEEGRTEQVRAYPAMVKLRVSRSLLVWRSARHDAIKVDQRGQGGETWKEEGGGEH